MQRAVILLGVVLTGCISRDPESYAGASISYSPDVFTLYTGSPIAPIRPTGSGIAGTKFSIDPALPAGLSIDSISGEITGTPTLTSPSTPYTVSTTTLASTNPAFLGLGFASDLLTLEVKDLPPPPPPPPPPGACPVGDLLFEFSPNDENSPIAGIRSFADRNGGESCLAVNWSFQADQLYVTASPIREEVAYMADGSLWIVSIKDPVDVNHNQTDDTPPDARKLNGDFRDLAWSPDGLWIACTNGAASGMPTILILNAEDLRANVAVPREIGIPRLGNDPTWSPDLDPQTAGYQGKIYFVGTYNELRSADLTDNALGQTLNVSAAVSVQTFPIDILAPACSPDGTKIAFISYEDVGGLPKKRLRILDVDNPAAHTLLATRNSPEDEDDEPAWWDNSTIVFSRFVFTGPNPGEGRFSLFQVKTDDSGLAEIFGPLGQPLDGHATRPAIVPAAQR